MRPNNTDSLITAAHRRRELTRAKAIQTIRELDHAGTPVTFQAVARASQVSRSWLYSQPDIRAEIERLRDATQQAPSPPIPTSQRASDPSLRQRLTEATQRNRQLAEDNARLRRQLAHALGDQRASPPALDPLPRGTQPVTLQ
jgi:small-conductance mechanosensitive channel